MYRFYIDETELPVAPGALNLKIRGANKTLTLINDGEINLLKIPGLTEINFDFLLPMSEGYSFCGEYRRPEYYLAKLERLMTGRVPFRFIVSRISPNGRRLFDTNMLVSLEDYEVSEKAETGPDITVSVKLKQYRPYATKLLTVGETADGGYAVRVVQPRETPDRPNGSRHNVTNGECLWGIAKKFMGDGAKYKDLYYANKVLMDTANDRKGNPWYTVYPGQELIIP